jgi:hypothetical protein
VKKLQILERIKKIGGFRNEKEIAEEVLNTTAQNLSNMKARGSLRSKYLDIIDWAIKERISLDYVFTGSPGIQLEAYGRFRKAQKSIDPIEFEEVVAIAYKLWDLLTMKDKEARARNINILGSVVEAHYKEMMPDSKRFKEIWDEDLKERRRPKRRGGGR